MSSPCMCVLWWLPLVSNDYLIYYRIIVEKTRSILIICTQYEDILIRRMKSAIRSHQRYINARWFSDVIWNLHIFALKWVFGTNAEADFINARCKENFQQLNRQRFKNFKRIWWKTKGKHPFRQNKSYASWTFFCNLSRTWKNRVRKRSTPLVAKGSDFFKKTVGVGCYVFNALVDGIRMTFYN